MRASAARARAKLADILFGAGLDSPKVLRAVDYPRCRSVSLAASGQNGCIARIQSVGWRTKAIYLERSLHCVKGIDCTDSAATVTEQSGPLLGEGPLPLNMRAGDRDMMPMVRCEVGILPKSVKTLLTNYTLSDDAVVESETREEIAGESLISSITVLLYEAEEGQIASGGIQFVSEETIRLPVPVSIALTGRTERRDSGYDAVFVNVDGYQIAGFGSIGVGDPNNYDPRSEIVNAEIKESLTISGGTGDGQYNVGVFWRAVIEFDLSSVRQKLSAPAHYYIAPPDPWPIPEHIETKEPLSS